jgi:hypothetical protein
MFVPARGAPFNVLDNAPWDTAASYFVVDAAST